MHPLVVKAKAVYAWLKHIFWIRFALDVSARFGKDNAGLISAGLAFFLILAFIPLLLVGIAALGEYFHLTHQQGNALHAIQDLLTNQVMPGTAGTEVKTLMESANVGETINKITATRGIAGLIGILGLLWAAIQIFISGSVAMNAAWETRENRGWIKLHLVALGLLVATGVLLVLSLAATGYGAYLSKAIPFGAVLLKIGTEIGAIIFSAIMYMAIYKFLPAAKVPWKAALCGAIIAAIGWEIAKRALAVYLLHPNTTLYGNLANLFIFILWVYYSMIILIVGAEASVVYARQVQSARSTTLRKTTGLTPSADSAVSEGSPLARSKNRDRARRIRKTGEKEGRQATRR